MNGHERSAVHNSTWDFGLVSTDERTSKHTRLEWGGETERGIFLIFFNLFMSQLLNQSKSLQITISELMSFCCKGFLRASSTCHVNCIWPNHSYEMIGFAWDKSSLFRLLSSVLEAPNQNGNISEQGLLFRLIMATVLDLTVEKTIGMTEVLQGGDSYFNLL